MGLQTQFMAVKKAKKIHGLAICSKYSAFKAVKRKWCSVLNQEKMSKLGIWKGFHLWLNERFSKGVRSMSKMVHWRVRKWVCGGGGLSVKPGTGPEHPQDTLEYPGTPPWLTGPHRNTLNYKNYVKKKKPKTLKCHLRINKYSPVAGKRRLGQIDELTAT